MDLIKNLKIICETKVHYLHCDNAGENIDIERIYEHEGMGMEFKYTAQGIPQQNGNVEWKFTTLFNLVCAMVNSGKFSTFLRNGLWAKAAITAILLENNLISPNRELSPFQHLLGKGKGIILSSVHKFGEMCITTYQDNSHQAKLAK